MTFGGLRLNGLYVWLTRSHNRYLMTVKKLDTHNGRILATRSTLSGEQLCTKWYSEGTISAWRKYNPALNCVPTDTALSPVVLFPESKACGPT